MTGMSEPVLNQPDRQSAVWKKVKQHLEERLTTLRARNDNSKGEAETEKLRGRIAEVKALILLDQDQTEIEESDDSG